MLQLDHLVLGASSLARGQEFLQDSLGVKIPLGGVHERFGTHNALMQLQGGAYFELIAIDPDREPQQVPRWFSLDDENTRQQLEQQPRLLTWVVNTHDLDSYARLAAAILSEQPATVTTMQRGALNWKMLIPAQGRYADALLPWVIEWPENVHPRAAMASLGCEQRSFAAWHTDPAGFGDTLRKLGADKLIEVKHAKNNHNNQQITATLYCNGRELAVQGLGAV